MFIAAIARGLYNPAAILAWDSLAPNRSSEGPRIPWLEEKAIGPTEEDLKYLKDLEEASPAEELLELYGVSGRG